MKKVRIKSRSAWAGLGQGLALLAQGQGRFTELATTLNILQNPHNELPVYST